MEILSILTCIHSLPKILKDYPCKNFCFLKVSKFQNEFMKSSFLPKYEPTIVRISALQFGIVILTIFNFKHIQPVIQQDQVKLKIRKLLHTKKAISVNRDLLLHSKTQSDLVIRKLLLTLKLFLILNTNLFLIKPFLITNFDCTCFMVFQCIKTHVVLNILKML